MCQAVCGTDSVLKTAADTVHVTQAHCWPGQAGSNITILQLDRDTLVPLPDPWHSLQWPPACVTWTVFATPSVPLAG